MRITKSEAETIAIQMVVKKKEQLSKMSIEISDLCTRVAKSQVPKQLLELSEKFPNYFKRIENIIVTGKGLNHEYFSLTSKVPSTEGYRQTIAVDDKNAEKLVKLFRVYEKFREEIELLQKDIAVALISLCTYAKITSEFKEAIPFLPFKEKNALAINISDIRKKL